MPIDHGDKNITEPSIGLNPVQFARLNQGGNDCPSVSAPITAREERVLTA
jgi:hypothetical protein